MPAFRYRMDMQRASTSIIGRAAAHAALLLLGVLLSSLAVAGLTQTIMSQTTVAQTTMRRETLKLTTATGVHSFEIEIAETDEQKARGLMFRRTMDDAAGMLFPYSPAQEITMWMRNTYISLDMVFIRADGIVHRVETGTEPFSEKVIASEGDAAAVLELKAGTANRVGLKAGDRVEHKLFAAPAKR